MNDQQQLLQHYSQQTYYQESMQQQQQQPFYLQPHTTMQHSYLKDPSMPEGQEQMFAYAFGPQQSTFLPPNLSCDNGIMVVPVGSELAADRTDGCLTPPVAADPSAVMGNGSVFFGMAPAMTISPSSLHSSELEHSSSLSDVDAFVNPQGEHVTDAVGKKRRIPSEDGNEEESLVSCASSGGQEQSSQKSRKRSRKVKTEEQTGSPPLVSCTSFGIQESPEVWTKDDQSVSDSKAAVTASLRKQHSATGKKKNPPPGGFKPWNTSPASSHLPSGSECINPITGEVSLPNLENLTKEEIRKVKNRASAQRSRTRKTEQTYELRVENSKLMERIEALKQALNDARPDLCAALALDKPEPSLLSSDINMRYEGLFPDDEEKQHMQMLINGLRSQLDAERNQRVTAEQKISNLEQQLEMLASTSPVTSSIPVPVAIPSKLTLDEVAERENAVHGSFPMRTSLRVRVEEDVLRSVSTSPVFHQTPMMAPAFPVGSSRSEQPRSFFGNAINVESGNEETSASITTPSNAEDKCALMFVMLVSMALFAMPLAMRIPSPQRTQEETPTSSARAGDVLANIQQSIVPPSMGKSSVTLTLLKPIAASDDLSRFSGDMDPLAGIKSRLELNQAVQRWLNPAASHGAHEDSSEASRGWIVVKADVPNVKTDALQARPNLWSDPTSPGLDSKWFGANDLSDSLAPSITDSSTFPSFFAPDSALWHKGPSPTLAPLIVEDPFADIDNASDLGDLQTGTRSSTMFDDQASTFLGSRRASIHSAWQSDDLSMTRSASASSTISGCLLDKTGATKFAKYEIEIDVEISTEIAFHSARNKSTRADLLDRSAVAKLLETGQAFLQ